jgi:CheY-like chemotaxis protein
MTNGDSNLKIQSKELTSRDDVKRVISEVLKRVDNFIRKGNLDEAEHCVLEARAIDPKNIYAYAFQERITVLKGQAHENQSAAAENQTLHEVKQLNELSPRNGESKPLQKVQPGIPLVVQHQQIVPVKNESKPEPALIAVAQLCKDEVSHTAHPSIPQIVMAAPQMNGLRAAEAQRKIDDDRNLKIQRMIKIAVDSVREEIKVQQMEIRTKEREEQERRERMIIQEAAEAARKNEEQRQIEIRNKTDEQLQQKIREALQRKPAVEPYVPPQPPIQREPSKLSHADQGGVVLRPAEFSVNAERFETLERYKLVLSSVWADGTISKEETSTLNQLRDSLSISSEEHARLEKEVQRETYIEAFKRAWHSGTITPENASVLAELRHRFQISNEEHLAIESKILQEIQPTKNRPTLLVVDDDERLLKVVSKSLNDAGFITTPVTTSDEAYAYLKDSSPDLILCDVNLETSTMGGFAFYEKVREFEHLRDTPFIFLSGLTDEALVRTGKELGVDDYLSKPVSEETLVATIKGKLRRYHELTKRMN